MTVGTTTAHYHALSGLHYPGAFVDPARWTGLYYAAPLALRDTAVTMVLRCQCAPSSGPTGRNMIAQGIALGLPRTS
jgi:hypothetical protein